MDINERQLLIIKELLDKEIYVTIDSIAKKLSISSRTVLRELSIIEKILEKYFCKLEKKGGKGVLLKGNRDDISKYITQLNSGEILKTYTPEYRKKYIISKLFNSKEPIKLFNLTRKLYVTEGTICNDLDKVVSYFKKFEIELIRKPGVGVFLSGSEEQLRKAIINTIYDNFTQEEIVNLFINNEIKKEEGSLLNLISNEVLIKVRMIIRNLSNELDLVSDNNKVRLIIHLALVVERSKFNNCSSNLSNNIEKNFEKYQEYQLALKIKRKIENLFEIKLCDNEIFYITMHLRGLKYISLNEVKDNLIYSSILAKNIIEMIEVNIGVFLEEDDDLLKGLTEHLELAIRRIEMNMQIRNPLLNDIKTFYPDVYQLALRCSKAIEKELDIIIPEDEVGYIAMHIAAAIEKSNSIKNRKYRVIVTCFSGIGTSTLLSSRLRREYENIKIVDIIPTIDMNRLWVRERKIDFIISTAPINLIDIPVVVVNPILLSNDKEKINSVINKIKLNSIYSTYGYYSENRGLRDNALKLRSYLNGLIDILDNFFIIGLDKVNSIEDIIDSFINNMISDNKAKKQLKKDLLLRESFGTTIIREYGAILLHCRSSAVSRGYFGVLRLLQNGLIVHDDDYSELINLIVVIVVPDKCDNSYRQVFSNLCGSLINNESLIENLYIKSNEEMLNILEEKLEQFYLERVINN